MIDYRKSHVATSTKKKTSTGRNINPDNVKVPSDENFLL